MQLEICPMRICRTVALLPSAGSLENIVSVAPGSLQQLTLVAGKTDLKCLQNGIQYVLQKYWVVVVRVCLILQYIKGAKNTFVCCMYMFACLQSERYIWGLTPCTIISIH